MEKPGDLTPGCAVLILGTALALVAVTSCVVGALLGVMFW